MKLWKTCLAWLRAERQRILRFCVVGGISTGADYLIYRLLLRWGLGTLPAKACSMCIVLAFAFIANKHWSFRAGGTGDRWEIARFALSQAVNIAVNALVNHLLVTLTGSVDLSFVLATGVAAAVNFLLQRYWVFGKKRKEQ